MVSYVILFIIKIFDNVISTAKNICQFKEMKVLSSILTIISQLIFYLVISHIIEDNTLLSIIIVAVASGLGNLLAFLINDRFKRAAKWMFILTSDNAEDVQKLCGYLAEHSIKYIANKGLTRENESTIHVIALSKSKDDSRLIERFLENAKSKYLKEII